MKVKGFKRIRESIAEGDIGVMPTEILNPEPEWQINADIDPEIECQTLKDITDGKLTVRQAARHLGILADKIVKK